MDSVLIITIEYIPSNILGCLRLTGNLDHSVRMFEADVLDDEPWPEGSHVMEVTSRVRSIVLKHTPSCGMDQKCRHVREDKFTSTDQSLRPLEYLTNNMVLSGDQAL